MPKWIRRRVHERETERYTGGGGKRRSTRPWQRDRGDEGVVCALSAGNQSRISDAQPVATCERRSMRSRIPVYDATSMVSAVILRRGNHGDVGTVFFGAQFRRGGKRKRRKRRSRRDV